MRRTSWLLLVALAVPAAVRAEESKVDPSIAATVKRFNEAFNRADPKEVASFWAEDGTLVSPVGEWGRGRGEVQKVYAHDIELFLKGSTSTFRIESVRSPKGGVALLDLDHEIANARMPDGSIGTMKLHVVILAVKKGSGWQWLDARPYAFLKPPPAPPAR